MKDTAKFKNSKLLGILPARTFLTPCSTFKIMADYLESNSSLDMQNRMFSYWESIKSEIEQTRPDPNVFKSQELPLARIKKIMKLDDDVKAMMISAEAPILFAKACEIFVRELTLRAWIHTEQNRRRTLQRNDISMAISDSDTDQFDFLIDIVPREESRPVRRIPPPDSSKCNELKLSSQVTGTVESTLINGEAHGLPQGTMILGNPGVNGASQGLQFIPSQSALVNGQQQVQYVLQLPEGANGTAQALATSANGQQPFTIQMVSQPFSTTTSDQAISSLSGNGITPLPAGSIIQQGPNGTLQVIQLPAAATAQNSIVLDTSTNGDGDRADTKMAAMQNQQLSAAQKQTFYFQQPDGTLIPVEGSGQQLIYTQGPNGQQQPMLISLGDGTLSGVSNEPEGDKEIETEDSPGSPLTRSAAKRKAAAAKSLSPKIAVKRSKPNIPVATPITVTKIDEDSVAENSQSTSASKNAPTTVTTENLNQSIVELSTCETMSCEKENISTAQISVESGLRNNELEKQ